MKAIKWPALLLTSLLLLPVFGGVLSVLLPAFGYLPALEKTQFTLIYFKQLTEQATFHNMIILTLSSGVISTLLATLMAMLITAHAYTRRSLAYWNSKFRPMLVVPHVAAAIAFGFLIAPSGFVLRLLSPTITGYALPPSWNVPNDDFGVVMTLAFALKEMPFILLLTVALLLQVQRKIAFEKQHQISQTLGFPPFPSFLLIAWPQVYPLIRLPIFAVLIYTGSSVEIPLILGPSNPSTISVNMLTATYNVDLEQRFIASALAIIQVVVCAASIFIWLGIEKIGAWVCQLLMRTDNTKWAFWAIEKISVFVLYFNVAIMVVALSSLFLLSFTGHWPFGSALPLSFTMINWQFALGQLQTPLVNSFGLACMVGILSLTLCVIAMETTVNSQKQARLLSGINYIPLLFPMIVFMFGAATLISYLFGAYSIIGVVILHFVVVTPYTWLSLSQQYYALDKRLIHVAHSLGASQLKCFFTIKMPLLWPSLMMALALGFSISLAQYLPTLLGSAGSLSTVTTEAVALASGGSRRLIAVYAIIQILMPALVFLVLTTNWKRIRYR